MTSICLAMNVRDAEQHVRRCIVSALPFVDRAVIIDTGSEDNTMDAVVEAIGDTIPLTRGASEWVGHYHNRTELLEHARRSGADYTLMLDADMEIRLKEGRTLRPLTKDEYMIPIVDRSLFYPLPLLTSTRKRFYYAGVAHAYLACADGPSDGELLDELELIDHGGGGSRPGKIERDRDLLAAEVAKNPGDRRSWFYLAQSYRDLDMVPEAIAAYKFRAGLGGWDEEVYQSLYNAGMLLSKHVNFYEGARLLLAAADMKHNRAEALRGLAGCAEAVANKIPFPHGDVLFIEPGAYTAPDPAAASPPLAVVPDPVPPVPEFSVGSRRKPRVRKTLGLNPKDVTAIIPTRGDKDLTPCLETLPYDDVIVWDNSKMPHDYKILGRYLAIADATNPVVYWQDDDVIFTAHKELLRAYEPGKVVANMDDVWLDATGYRGKVVLMGAGSLCDAHLAVETIRWYLQHYPFDDDLLVECDFAFGTLAPSKVVNLGYETREFSDDDDRLYKQPGQTERKWKMIDRCLRLLNADAPGYAQRIAQGG